MEIQVIKKKLATKLDELTSSKSALLNQPEILLNVLEDLSKDAVIFNYLTKNNHSTVTSPKQNLASNPQPLIEKETLSNISKSTNIPLQDKASEEKVPSPEKKIIQKTLSEDIYSKQEPQNPLVEILQDSPIKDISNALNLNERHLYANELFKGNIEEFIAVLNKIESANSLNEALLVIKPFKNKYHWEKENQLLQNFITLIERRFST